MDAISWTAFAQICIAIVICLVVYLIISAVEMAKNKKDNDDG